MPITALRDTDEQKVMKKRGKQARLEEDDVFHGDTRDHPGQGIIVYYFRSIVYVSYTNEGCHFHVQKADSCRQEAKKREGPRAGWPARQVPPGAMPSGSPSEPARFPQLHCPWLPQLHPTGSPV